MYRRLFLFNMVYIIHRGVMCTPDAMMPIYIYCVCMGRRFRHSLCEVARNCERIFFPASRLKFHTPPYRVAYSERFYSLAICIGERGNAIINVRLCTCVCLS